MRGICDIALTCAARGHRTSTFWSPISIAEDIDTVAEDSSSTWFSSNPGASSWGSPNSPSPRPSTSLPPMQNKNLRERATPTRARSLSTRVPGVARAYRPHRRWKNSALFLFSPFLFIPSSVFFISFISFFFFYFFFTMKKAQIHKKRQNKNSAKLEKAP